MAKSDKRLLTDIISEKEVFRNGLAKVMQDEERDSVVILVATAWLDDLLYALLKVVLKQKSKTVDKLISNNGPIGSIQQRASLAYGLRLIPTDYYTNVVLLSEIRNNVAHSHIERSFDDPEIIIKTKHLILPNDYGANDMEQRLQESITPHLIIARRYKLVIGYMAIRLMEESQKIQLGKYRMVNPFCQAADDCHWTY